MIEVSDQRREHLIVPIVINDVTVTKVVIDPHYEKKHSASINDELILELVSELDGRQEAPQDRNDPYSYFATLIELRGKNYRLIWLQEDNTMSVGIINAYRDKRKK